MGKSDINDDNSEGSEETTEELDLPEIDVDSAIKSSNLEALEEFLKLGNSFSNEQCIIAINHHKNEPNKDEFLQFIINNSENSEEMKKFYFERTMSLLPKIGKKYKSAALEEHKHSISESLQCSFMKKHVNFIDLDSENHFDQLLSQYYLTKCLIFAIQENSIFQGISAEQFYVEISSNHSIKSCSLNDLKEFYLKMSDNILLDYKEKIFQASQHINNIYEAFQQSPHIPKSALNKKKFLAQTVKNDSQESSQIREFLCHRYHNENYAIILDDLVYIEQEKLNNSKENYR